MRTLVVEQGHLVLIASERVLRPVGDEQRQLFLAPFGFGVRLDVVGFGSKADTERRLWPRSDTRKDVDGRLQLQCQRCVRFLEF